MEWNDVRIFLAVARGGSFGGAARQLGVSHPTVGRRIKVLESETGHRLFRRTSEGLVLTDAGDDVLRAAEAMGNAALSMERRLAGASEQLEGILRISSADWFASYGLAPVFAEPGRRHPGIVPELIAGYRLLDLSRRDPAVRRVFTSTSRSVQAQMCLQGAGIAVLPRPLGDAIPGLRLLDAGEAPPTRDIWVGYHQDLRHMDRLRALLDITTEKLAG
ncbi:LysR family transcriptional regulator [Luteibacter sp. 9133]|uniref:LysR family transcriptional regulator n=1 Tax=Luteibacter sp. 9133 TaxID=1500891 RepID=UPI0005BC5815|nr:LysR family transcriptional regulator [Luteibacter sp. 9133]